MSQTTTRKDRQSALGEVVRSVKTVFHNHCPHWKSHVTGGDRGHARIEFTLRDCQSGAHLSIDATESFESGDTGRYSEKRVMVGLEEQAARQLYAILKERFERFNETKLVESDIEQARRLVAL